MATIHSLPLFHIFRRVSSVAPASRSYPRLQTLARGPPIYPRIYIHAQMLDHPGIIFKPGRPNGYDFWHT